jgi:FKBP-type peptidyl-prolyl cis-trans isomerase 2
MLPGETRRMTLQPREAYGRVRSTLIRHIPRRRFPKNMVLEIGKRLTMVHGIVGRRRRVTIIEIKLDSVLVDGNHPLAGQSIDIEVLLVSLVSMAALPNRKQNAD